MAYPRPTWCDRDMTQAGGSAAINGFLYQILHHLGWLADIRLTGKLAGQRVEDARLVLEPRNGGDAQAKTSGLYLVEQYKTRATGTWALANVRAVLRDLRKAVPPLLPTNACYRFVTDGKAGELAEFDRFKADLKSVENLDHLDNEKKQRFSKTLSLTDWEFFVHIAEKTRSDGGETTAEERATVFHLLSHFEMEFGVSGSALAEAVEQRLRPYVANLGDEHGVRERLIGHLIEKLSEGETRLDIAGLDAMFRSVGLSPNRLHKMASLPQKLAVLTRQHLIDLKYRHEGDVRAVPHWPEEKPVLVIAGESGTGKTWQLGKLLEACTEADQINALVPAAKTAEDILIRAARNIWQRALGETSEKSLIAVSNFLREEAFDPQSPLFTIAVDDIRDVDLARDLIRQVRSGLDVRLVLTVPLTIASALELTDSEAIHVHRVDDFSIDELDALLKISGQRWADLPPDLKRLLRKPILAGLFLNLPHASVQDAPHSEYEIFEAFWKQITAKCKPGDKGVVKAFAAYVRGGNPYPLPRENWGEIGLTDENLARLEAAGWLRSSIEYGEAAFAHDRLLNWAVAQHIERKFSRGELAVDGLYDLLVGTSDGSQPDLFRQFAYVPMDTFWLLAADEQNSKGLGQLVEKMENHHEFGSYGRDLYIHLLPTLGQRSVPVLLERIDAIATGSDDDYRVNLIGKAFADLARQENVDLRTAIDSLLNSPSWDRQSVALAALEVAPDPQCLDCLWEIHQQCFDALEDNTDRRAYHRYQATSTALQIQVEQDPEWLRNRIHAADAEKERVSELGYLLSGLEHPDATAIWREMRDVLMRKVSTNKPRSLLRCIARFSDHEKIDFAVKHLSNSEDIASATALATLAILNPGRAIDRLVDLDDSQKFWSNQWLRPLLRAHPELTRRRIRELAESDPKGRRLIEHFFGKRPDELDEATLQFMLRSLETELGGHLDKSISEDSVWLCHPLDLLGRIARPSLLNILQAEAGGELERMIVDVACSRLHTNSRTQDPVLESARRVLVLIAGAGVTTLINRELDSEHFWVRHRGLNWAFVRADDLTIEQLATIARRPVPYDAKGQPKSGPYQEFCGAMTALATLGADEALVEILTSTGMVEVPLDLAKSRAHRGPMSKALTEKAMQTLQNAASPENSLVISLLTAWLGGDADLIPEVRTVLERADPGSRVARYACLALHGLRDQSDDFARLSGLMSQTKANAKWGLGALIGLGERGLEFLRNWLQSQNNTECVEHSDRVIRALYAHARTRKLAVDAAAQRCRSGGFMLHPLYDIAVESGEPDLREQILDKAFAENPVATTALIEAIRGLAKFDTTRAVEAIELGLQRPLKIEQALCRLLVRIAPETAAERLIETVTSIERKSLHQAVGRTLRRLDPKIVTQLVVERMSGSESVRKIAAELAGWVPVPEISEALGRLADRDNSTEIRQTALGALYLHRQEETVRALLAEFQRAAHAHRWALLVAILEAADPYLLTEREDPLWLGLILKEDIPGSFAHYATSVIRKRKQNERIK